jgi:hypothetical protein
MGIDNAEIYQYRFNEIYRSFVIDTLRLTMSKDFNITCILLIFRAYVARSIARFLSTSTNFPSFLTGQLDSLTIANPPVILLRRKNTGTPSHDGNLPWGLRFLEEGCRMSLFDSSGAAPAETPLLGMQPD